jgi:hypothetical protein
MQSQIENYIILNVCKELGTEQLIPSHKEYV